MKKPRDLVRGFWDGRARLTGWYEGAGHLVHMHLGSATPSELRRMAAWMLRAAKYAEWAKRNKRIVQGPEK